jgi:DNA polymerase
MPRPKLYIDIETRSRVDLKKFGVYAYSRCPDFAILIASYAMEDDPVQTAFGIGEITAIDGLWSPKVEKVAHNAQFERVCFSRVSGHHDVCYCGGPSKEDPWLKCNNECGGREGTFLDPADWRDTQAIAGEHGYPQSLAQLGKALDGEEKDEAGTRLINLFCKPVATGKRRGQWNGPETHPMEWLDFVAYCEQDVEVLRDVDRKLPDWPTETERKLFYVDQAIADRGIQIDMELALSAVSAGKENAEEQMARARELTGLENPNSVQQISRWIGEQGIKVPNMKAETVEKLLDGDLRADVREVLELRQELALAAPKKFEAALQAAGADGRLRGTLKFFGAHTGRWAGRGTQIQNLPRHTFTKGKEHDDDSQEACIFDVKAGFGASSDNLKRLVRPMFIVDGCVIDYSSIEARVIAWVAGEDWALKAFAGGRDIYVETAERMSTPEHPLDRSQGKVAVLALGYNGGVNSLRAMGADGDDDTLRRLVVQWRKANPAIVRLWARLGDAFGDTGPVGKHLRVTESHDKMGRAVHIELPSGRAISYHGTKWERYTQIDSKTGRKQAKEGWRYADPKNPFNFRQRIGTYGGRLAENITQAIARDVLGEALIRLEENGFRVVGHVHDEILVEGSYDYAAVKDIMTELPDWATGLPIDGDGFTTYRYRKG